MISHRHTRNIRGNYSHVNKFNINCRFCYGKKSYMEYREYSRRNFFFPCKASWDKAFNNYDNEYSIFQVTRIFNSHVHSVGQRISRMFGYWKAGSMLRLSLICFPGKSWVGLLQITCEQHYVLARYKWPFGAENLGLACSITRIGAANMTAMSAVNICLS